MLFSVFRIGEWLFVLPATLGIHTSFVIENKLEADFSEEEARAHSQGGIMFVGEEWGD